MLTSSFLCSQTNFLVLVLSDSVADKAWSAYLALGPLPEAFDARRANVLVVSDDGVPPDTQKRIIAALTALPDHGNKVATLER